MKTRLGFVVLVLAMLLMVGCSSDDVDECSISKEEMDNPPADAVSYTIINQTCTTISTIYVTPEKCDWWGTSWMGKDVLHPNESFTVNVSPGRYSFHFEDAVGIPYYEYNQKIRKEKEYVLSNADGTSVDECQASVTIVNQLDQPITGFFIHWNGGMNWLGQDSILPGESFQFLMFPGTYDVMVSIAEFDRFYAETDVLVDGHIVFEITERNQ